MVPAFPCPVVEEEIFAGPAIARQAAASGGAEPVQPAQGKIVVGKRPRLDPPGAPGRDLRPEHRVEEARDLGHAALHATRAPAPGDPQAASLLGGAEARLRITVELGDIGKALKCCQRQQCRRPVVELAVDLGPVLGTEVRGDIGKVPQCGGDDAYGHGFDP